MEKGFWNEATEPSDGPDFSSLPEFMGRGFLINYGECEKINVELANSILSMKPSATASERIRQLFGGMFYIFAGMLGVLSLFGFIIAVIEGKLMEDVFNAEGSWLTMFGFMAIAPWMIVLASEKFNGFRTLVFDAAAGSVSSMPKPIAVGKVRTFKHEKVQAIVVRNHDFESTRYHPEAQMKYSDSLEPGVYLLTTEGLHGIFSLLSPEVAGDATGPLAEYYGVEVFINPDNEVEYTRKHEMM
tara:strand:- start:1854 stop:2582 length:729 start_codon:yes stop_codon:yes gene_type:complete